MRKKVQAAKVLLHRQNKSKKQRQSVKHVNKKKKQNDKLVNRKKRQTKWKT